MAIQFLNPIESLLRKAGAPIYRTGLAGLIQQAQQQQASSPTQPAPAAPAAAPEATYLPQTPQLPAGFAMPTGGLGGSLRDRMMSAVMGRLMQPNYGNAMVDPALLTGVNPLAGGQVPAGSVTLPGRGERRNIQPTSQLPPWVLS